MVPVIESMNVTIPTVTVRNDVYFSGHLPTSNDETSQTNGRRIAKDRHSEGCNVLFLDWHAEKVKAQDVKIAMFRER